MAVSLLAACSDGGSGQPSGSSRSGVAQLFRFADPEIAESSGVASASYRNDLLFTHNDSGDAARFFAVDFAGKTVAVYSITGVQAVDWEDMARGPHQDRTRGQSLYFGDIGNNLRARDVVDIYEVNEPVVGQDESPLSVRSVMHVRYPDGPYDAEALLVHPRTGDILIVTKGEGGVATVHRRVGPSLERVAEIPVRDLVRLSGVMRAIESALGDRVWWVTGGAISPDGDRVVLRTYGGAFEWPLFGTDYARSFAAEPTSVELPLAGQGEAITYTADGRAFLTTTEGIEGPVHRISR